MKAWHILILVIFFVGAMFLLFMGVRWASNLTTQVSVVNPEPGVHCALASTGDGAALSCYPETWVRK